MAPLLRRISVLIALLPAAMPSPAFAEDGQAALETWQRYQNACSQSLFDENYPQAVATCGTAAAIAERLEPGPHLEGSLNDLATAYLRRQDYVRAEAILKRVLDIRVKALGPDHIMAAGTLALLGAVYRKTGQDQAAKRIDAEVGRITGNCRGHLTEEQREEITGPGVPDPCAHETLPPFLQ